MSIISSTQTIITEVGTRLNEDSTVAAFEDQVTTDINQCTRDVSIEFPNAPFLQTSGYFVTVAGQSEYSNFSDFEKMYDITNPTLGVKLTFLEPSQFDLIAPSATGIQGSPTIYTIINGGTVVKFLPTPNAVISAQARYQKALGTVSATSSTPPIPTKYNELYCLYGEFRGLRRQQRYNEADNVEAKYEVMKQKMINDLNRKTMEEVPIRSGREFGGGLDYGNPITNIFNNAD